MIEENEMYIIERGKPSPFVDAYEKAKEGDGVIFGAVEYDQGYTHMIFYEDFGLAELNAIMDSKVRVRVVRSVDDYVLLLFKFGSQNLIQEIVFDPTLYPDSRALQLAEDNNLVTIMCIERRNNIVLGIRQANLPLKMIQLCRVAWAKAFLQPNYSEKYANWYAELQQKYSTEQLWKMGIDLGYLGERYDLDEVKFSFKMD